MKQRVHNVWTSMMMIAAVGPAHQGRMWKHLEWANWFCAAEATLGRSPIPRQEGSGNDCSWMVANVTDRFLKRHNFYNRAMVDEMNRRPRGLLQTIMLEWKRNLVAHGDARVEKWRGKRRMEWVANTLALYRNSLYPALLPLMRTPRLPAADWTDTPRQFKWTRPFRRKTKSGFCACAITFQLASTINTYL